MIIVDASAALSQVLPGQKTQAADDFFSQTTGPFGAPDVFVWEFINNLLRAERIGALKIAEADAAASDWLQTVEVTAGGETLNLIGLSRSERLSLFDAAYLHLAEQRGASIASRDTALLEPARRRGLAVHDLR